jgi:hypothetical protein
MGFEKININDIEEAETIPLFDEVKEWQDVDRVFAESGIIRTTSGNTYSYDNLVDGITIARASQFTDFNGITRSEGLRAAVARLMIREAADLEQLSRILTQIPTVAGSAKDYTIAEIVSAIQQYIDGQSDSSYITNSFGLRETVLRLHPGT